MKALSDLTERDLRHLFEILERDNPDALISGLESLQNECGDDDNVVEDEEEENKVGLPQVLGRTEDNGVVGVMQDDASDIETEDVVDNSEVVMESISSFPERNDGLESNDDDDDDDDEPPEITEEEEEEDVFIEDQRPMSDEEEDSIDGSPTQPPDSTPKAATQPPPPIDAGEGCYLHYDASSAKLKLQYSKSHIANAIGFYSSSTIPAFKFKKNFGRADLIGNCASGVQGRKNYYSGWCQFIRAARSAFKAELESYGQVHGQIYLYPRRDGDQGLDVDIYTYDEMATIQTNLLPLNTSLQNLVCNAEAVACLPKHSDIFLDVRKIDCNRWLTEASNIGASIRMRDAPSVLASRPSPRKASSVYSIKKLTSVSTKQCLPKNTPMDDALSTTTEEESHVYTNPVKTEDEHSHEQEEIELPSDQNEVQGCYLLYDSDSGKLMLQYSKTTVRNAIGFYCAGPNHSIQPFKFKRNFGRAELIGNCASGVTGRKNFYSGWCQFIRAARAVQGPLWIYPRNKNTQGLDVDIYVYYQDPKALDLGEYQTVKLVERERLNVTDIDAVACVPKFTDFFEELKLVEINRWLTEGNAIGATSRFT